MLRLDSFPSSVISPSHSIRYSRSRGPKTILEIKKRGHISLGDKQAYYLQVFKTLLTTKRKLLGR